jgi:hypothetical protein
MSTVAAVLAAMALLVGVGILPVAALIGRRPVILPLAPLAGAVMAAIAVAACLWFGGGVLGWFVGIAVTLNLVALARWRVTTERPPWRRDPEPGMARGTAWAGAIGLLAAVGFSLSALHAPSIGFDARTIWMLHAVWYSAGHSVSVAALKNPALPFAHASYPPLVGGTVAVSWLATGNHSYTLGVDLVALLNACAVLSAAWVVVEVGGQATRQTGAISSGTTGVSGTSVGARAARAARAAPELVGVLVAVVLVLVTAGVAGTFATNGYADLLWAASAVGAVGFGLVLPLNRANLATAALLLLVAGLTKNEGTATAVAIVVLVAARVGVQQYLVRRKIPLGAVIGGVLGILALSAWALLCRLIGAAPNVETIGKNAASDATRAHLTYTSMAAHLHVLVLAAAVALVGAAWLRRSRRRVGLGSDLWTWAALVAGVAIVAGVYVFGPGVVQLWLVTSVHRTTFFPALLGWWVIGVWAVVATSALVTPLEPSGTPLRSDSRAQARC